MEVNEEKYWADFLNGKSLAKYGDKVLKKINVDIFFLDELRLLEMKNGHGEWQ